jgi:hypothetical protein
VLRSHQECSNRLRSAQLAIGSGREDVARLRIRSRSPARRPATRHHGGLPTSTTTAAWELQAWDAMFGKRLGTSYHAWHGDPGDDMPELVPAFPEN